MNERLERLLDKLEKGLDAGVDFLGDQIPPYAQEVLEWHFFVHGLPSVLLFVASGLFLVAAVKTGRIAKGELAKSYLDRVEAWFFAFVASVCLALLCLLCSLMEGVKAAKAKIAPRVVIIEHIRGELK